MGKKFHFTPVKPGQKPGYRLADASATNASWRLEREYALGVRGGRMGFYAWDWDGKFSYPRIISGQKISTGDPAATSRIIKKTASFFGASLVGI